MASCDVIFIPTQLSPFHRIEQYVQRINRFKSQVMASPKDEDKLTEHEQEMIDSYKVFIRGVIGEYLSATAKLNATPEELQSASDKIYKITKYAYKINQQVENMNKSENPLEDIFDISVQSLQNMTDRYARNGTEGNVTAYPFWATYLGEVFRDSPELHLDLSKDMLLTSRMDMQYMKNIFGHVLAKQSPEIVELYIWFSLLEDMLLYTTDEMRLKHREYLRSVSGVASSPSRSLYCTTVVNQMMGMALSFGIAEPEFLTQTKGKVQTMLGLIQGAFYQLVHDLRWMDGRTKKETLEKAKRMVSLIGFPEWILNKTALEKHYQGVSGTRRDSS